MKSASNQQKMSLLVSAALVAAFVPVQAQTLRDPTLPPAAVATSALGDAAVKQAVLQTGTLAVMVRGGVAYVVVGTRLYAKGQQVGQARIEHISETQVWVREDGLLRKIPVFGGIERHAHIPSDAVKNHAGTAVKTVPAKP